MKKIIGYLKEYLRTVDKNVLFLSTLFVAVAVFANYYYGLNRYIANQATHWQYLSWFGLFFIVFGYGYWLQAFFGRQTFMRKPTFWVLLVAAAALFAWKMVFTLNVNFSSEPLENAYWRAVVYWPFKVLALTLTLYGVHQLFSRNEPFYGVTLRQFSAKPYLLMLLLMVPLIALASLQEDFIRMYPRMQKIAYLQQPEMGWHKLLYQLSYGSDFFSIELFFRGFLIMAFTRFAGKGAILPMAIFYCTIHFGKPLGECISSYFGGVILGVVSYHTRTIIGGFMVHVGIAWLMELGGYMSPLSL